MAQCVRVGGAKRQAGRTRARRFLAAAEPIPDPTPVCGAHQTPRTHHHPTPPRYTCMMPTKRVLGQRLRSKAVNSLYSKALLSSMTRSARKLKITTASPAVGA